MNNTRITRLLAALLFGLCLFSVQCQLERLEPIPTTFRKVIPVDTSYTVLKIYQRSDGQYYLCLSDDDDTGLTLLLDSEGGGKGFPLKYIKTFRLWKSIPDGEDGFLVIGTSYFQNENLYTGFLSRVRPNQMLQWNKNFSFGSTDALVQHSSNASGVILTPNQEVVVCGYHESSTDTRAGIAIFNLGGDLQISTINKASGQSQAWDVAQRPTGEYLLLNLSSLLNVNATGTDILPPIPIQMGQFTHILYIADDSYVLYKASELALVNTSGKILWYNKLLEKQNIEIGEVIAARDGSIVLCGQKSDSAFVGKYSFATGDTLWTRTFMEPATSSARFHSVSETVDRGFILGGSIIEAGKTNLYVVKTDQEGIVR